jgi:protein TonB
MDGTAERGQGETAPTGSARDPLSRFASDDDIPGTMRPLPALAAIALFGAAACPPADSTLKAVDAMTEVPKAPDELPVMLNQELPFKYPDALFASKVQGNVILRIYIDTAGRVWPESTSVMQTSGYPQLDSAAVRGAPQLRFVPAKLKHEPIGVAIKLPVFFRRPDAPPLPGDTILRKKATAPKTP